VGGLIRGIEPDADPLWREFKGSAPSLRILVSRVMIAVCVPFEFWIVYGLHRRNVFNKKV